MYFSGFDTTSSAKWEGPSSVVQFEPITLL